jgi:tRNA (guanine37-N1)-methyltransferase
LADREISIGDYVLSGGELGAAVIVDAVTRLIPGAVGNEASTRQESFFAGPELGGSDLADKSVRPTRFGSTKADSTCGSGGLLDYPHYTRPAEFHGIKVPEVLLNGNHDDIRRWRRRSALEKTLHNRPDLLDRAKLSDDDKELMAEIEAIAGDEQ